MQSNDTPLDIDKLKDTLNKKSKDLNALFKETLQNDLLKDIFYDSENMPERSKKLKQIVDLKNVGLGKSKSRVIPNKNYKNKSAKQIYFEKNMFNEDMVDNKLNALPKKSRPILMRGRLI